MFFGTPYMYMYMYVYVHICISIRGDVIFFTLNIYIPIFIRETLFQQVQTHIKLFQCTICPSTIFKTRLAWGGGEEPKNVTR